GDSGLVGEVATRLAGSSDLFADDLRTPASSINFVTCHDGFTLADLVSFDGKHNEANGEDNRDGSSDNLSWNCGAEGDTGDAAVLALRRRQAKNFTAVLLLSQGVPMILAGDEVLHSQRGNNNAYCQDNELSWFDWGLVEANRDMLRFVRELIALRRRHAALRGTRWLTGQARPGHDWPDVAWHGTRLGEPGWNDPGAQALAFPLGPAAHGEGPLHVLLNMSAGPLEFVLPSLGGALWRRAVDTALPSPDDVRPPGEQVEVAGASCVAQGRSVVVLEAP